MAGEYDGPSYYRHGSERENDRSVEKKSQLQEAKKPFKASPKLPPFRNYKHPVHEDLTSVVRFLHKEPGEYYLVVQDDELKSDTKSVSKSKTQTNVEKKFTQIKSTQALGHSLNDILQSESQAQKQLKIFDEQHKK